LFLFTGILIVSVIGIVTESLATLIPPSWERQIFGKGPANLPLDGKPATAFLQNVLEKLKSHERDPLYDFKVRILCDPLANAYIIPGGTIWVTAGLEKSVKTENGLAFILAHEMGHFQDRDQLRGLFRGLAFGFFNLSFDSNQERRADSHALYLVKQTYGHVHGADEFFGAMDPETHPPSQERLDQVEEWEKLASGTPKVLPHLPSWSSECERAR
jgi:Zn-dependent protease with chaperone function